MAGSHAVLGSRCEMAQISTNEYSSGPVGCGEWWATNAWSSYGGFGGGERWGCVSWCAHANDDDESDGDEDESFVSVYDSEVAYGRYKDICNHMFSKLF